MRLFGHDRHTALTISASLAQIGEFSFILLGLGITLGLLPTEARDIVLAAAIVSILVNPFLFNLIDRLEARTAAHGENATAPKAGVPADKVVLVGGGRIGGRIAGRNCASHGCHW